MDRYGYTLADLCTCTAPVLCLHRPRAVRKLQDGLQAEEGSDCDVDLHDKENVRSTPVREQKASAEDVHVPQGVTPSR